MTVQNNTLTQAQLKEVLHYNPETGLFSRLKNKRSPHLIGKQAGYLHKHNGYVYISVKSKKYRAHRLAWLYVYGSFPKNQIDHINRNKSDNRISNLRDCTQTENMQNKGAPKKKSSLPLGVKLTKHGRYEARIGCNGVQSYLGTFGAPEEALAAYQAAKAKLHI